MYQKIQKNNPSLSRVSASRPTSSKFAIKAQNMSRDLILHLADSRWSVPNKLACLPQVQRQSAANELQSQFGNKSFCRSASKLPESALRQPCSECSKEFGSYSPTETQTGNNHDHMPISFGNGSLVQRKTQDVSPEGRIFIAQLKQILEIFNTAICDFNTVIPMDIEDSLNSSIQPWKEDLIPWFKKTTRLAYLANLLTHLSDEYDQFDLSDKEFFAQRKILAEIMENVAKITDRPNPLSSWALEELELVTEQLNVKIKNVSDGPESSYPASIHADFEIMDREEIDAIYASLGENLLKDEHGNNISEDESEDDLYAGEDRK